MAKGKAPKEVVTKPEGKRKVSFDFAESIVDKLEYLKYKEKIPKGDIVQKALVEYLSKEVVTQAKAKEEKIKVSFDFTESIIDKLDKLKYKEKIKKGDIVQKALIEYFKQWEKDNNQKFPTKR